MPDYKIDIRLRFDSGPDLPVSLAAPFAIKQTRGLDPYMFTVVLSDYIVDQFPASANSTDGCKCAFVFTTPDNQGGTTTATWQCYLVRAERGRAGSGTWNATFADERWKADYNRHTVSYNTQWPDGSYRDNTLNSSGGQWRVVQAIENLITDYIGGTFDTSRCQKLTHILLPNNLGNSDYGGYVDATWSEIIKPMLYAINADLIIGTDRKWIIVPKTAMQAAKGKTVATPAAGVGGGPVDKLRGYKRIVDTVAVPQMGWELPRKLRVGFEIMTEAVIDSRPSTQSTTSSTPGAQAVFDQPENVMRALSPELMEPEAWWNDQNSETADTEWLWIPKQLYTLGYIASEDHTASETLVARNYFLPNIIPLKRAGEFDEIKEDPDPTLNSIAYQKKLWIDAALKEAWRKFYRVKFIPSQDGMAPAIKALAGLRFGRLTPGGDTRSRGAVYADWCEESAHALQFNPASPTEARFSDNHAYSSTRPAPFTARWIAQNGNELIFEIVEPSLLRISQNKVFPGTFAAHLTYGDWFTLSGDGYMANTELHGTFTIQWDFRIYLAGSLCQPDRREGQSTPVGEIIGRHLVIERDMYPEGSIESLDIKAYKTTANFGYTIAQMARPMGFLGDQWPAALLNTNDLNTLVDRAVEKAKAQFDQGQTGGISIAGVQPIADGCIAEGDIYEMALLVGDPDLWSIKSQYIVLPGISNVEIEPKDRDGVRPNLISNE